MEEKDYSLEALNKLFGVDEHPVKFQRHKYEIQLLQNELNDLVRAKRTRVHRALFGWLKDRSSIPLEAKVDSIQERIDELSKIWIEAHLVRISTFDHYLTVQQYMALRLFMLEELNKRQLSVGARAVEEQTINIATESYFAALRIQKILKRKVGDSWEPVFSENDLGSVDQRLVRDLLEIYTEKFVLTKAHLKK